MPTPEPSRAVPSRAEPSRAEPGRATLSRAEPSRAAPDRAASSRAELSRAEPSRAASSRAEPSRAGALLWLGCLQFFVCEQLARLGWQGPYSLRFQYISDLGALGCTLTCSHFHALMNASFATQGVLIAGGTVLLRRSLLPRLSGGIAFVLLLLSALGVSTLAYAPSDVDANLHISGARLHLACGALAMLCVAVAIRLNRRRLPPWTLSAGRSALLCGAVATLGDILLVLGGPAQSFLGVGTLERLAAYPLPLFLAFTGALALRAGTRLPTR